MSEDSGESYDAFAARIRSTIATIEDPHSPHWKKLQAPASTLGAMASVGACALWVGDKKIEHHGTAWVASPNVVVTAWHVIEDLRRRRVLLGAEARLSFPGQHGLGPPVALDVDRAQKFGGQTSTGARFDVARIPFASEHTAIGISVETSQEWTCVSVPGYPKCSLPNDEIYDGDVLCADRRKAHREGAFVVHQADTEVGHSGSPILLCDGQPQRVFAIHVGGEWKRGRGVPIDAALQNFILRG